MKEFTQKEKELLLEILEQTQTQLGKDLVELATNQGHTEIIDTKEQRIQLIINIIDKINN